MYLRNLETDNTKNIEINMFTDKVFKKYDLITGWITFSISLIVYGLTVEPTVSFWDCGEYISTAAKLQVGHPPGAPFFQMMGAFFAFFAPNADSVALFVNYMSVFSSAFTILFLYFIITNLTRKIVTKNGEAISTAQGIAILGSGFVGALAYTFSDSFWYNAVEAEVYAMAMLFMAAMFWLGIKWTDNLHSERGDKWLILISFVIGLSFGVHFMALLTIPAIGMLYFFNSNFKKTFKNFVIANVVSIAVLLLIFKLILPYTLAYFGYLEVFFVNSFGLPFNSGTIIAGLSIALAFFLVLRYTYKHKKVYLQTITLCILFVLIGFSSWLMIPIRANADVVINENSPTDARLLLAYYRLEQYPKTHLFYGPMYSDKYADLDEENPYEDGQPKYERDYVKNEYVIVNDYKNTVQSPNSKHVGLLPRMWHPSHADNYMQITNYLKFNIKPEYFSHKELYQAVDKFKKDVERGRISTAEYDRFLTRFREYLDIEKPSFTDNMYYMLSYQMGYMYWRYFMWNFVGRQDDIQGKQDNHGRWLSGIKFIDEIRLGSQDNLPSDVLNNKARNTYFFLPLILGLVGLWFMYTRSERKTWVIFVLFMFTGLALKVYLNEKPFEPRERDYALVGSFFAFAIWIGVGVYALFDMIRRHVNPKLSAPLVIVLTFLSVPTLMAYQNWDDHDRSGKYSAQAIAHAYLDSIQEDVGAMIFTIGDIDTFLLWYAQEIEGYRTDVRTINTSLLQTDWYIDQMKRKAYESDAIPSQLVHSQYAHGINEVVHHIPRTENIWNIKDFMNWITSEDPKTKQELTNGRTIKYYPTNKIRIPVNKENVLKSGLVKPEDADLIVDYIDLTLPPYLDKARLVKLDILANNDWKRPIYFTGGSSEDQEYIWLKDYLQLDGFVYKLVPIKTAIDKENPYDIGRIDTELMYDIVMKWKWGNMGSSEIYHDIETRRNSNVFRGHLARLIEKLIEQDKIEKAKNVLDLVMKNLPMEYYDNYFYLNPYITSYYKVGEAEKGRALAEKVVKKYQEELTYYLNLSANELYENYANVDRTIRLYMILLVEMEEVDPTFYKEQQALLRQLIAPLLSEEELEEYDHIQMEIPEEQQVTEQKETEGER